ncbi:hypothetical protein G9C98_001637 [Cotesia typhae]|uniref:Uncharacterized protein n=1 Tax=Cotesia typhae TaxID=2053667 RepID=A0A8J5UPH5_9HYME|nr:hypothetical protein G9C98_001637 [Cotesia typhae]
MCNLYIILTESLSLLNREPWEDLGCGLTITIRSSLATSAPPGNGGAIGLTGLLGSSSPSDSL